MPMARPVLAALALACLLSTASARRILQSCSGLGYSIDNGVTKYNFVCVSNNMNFGPEGMICVGETRCYAAGDMTCSGTPIDCPVVGSPPTVAPTMAPTEMPTMDPTMSYKYRAYLKGKNEIPAHVTKTWGWGFVEWSSDSTMATITVEVKHGVDVYAAHIHNCSATCNGPVYVPIFSYTDAMGAREYKSGTFAVSIMVDLATYPMLGELIMSGNAYVNVHTKAYPGGEIRAQLMDTAQTIVSVASGIPELSYFVAAVAAAPGILVPASSPTTEATVFAPSNAAFEAALMALGMPIEDLLNDTALLTSVLAYHVHGDGVVTAAMAPGPPGVNITTILEGAMLHVVAVNGTVMINDAKVIVADISVNNFTSVIHIIDKVLMPMQMPAQTIVTVASGIPELSYFVAAVAAAPGILAAAGSATTEVTVFAPSNAAFEAALVALGLPIEDLLSNTALLTSVLAYHVHDSVLMAAMAPGPPGVNITTLVDGAMLLVEAVNGTVMINDAKVIVADISVNNFTSVIHIIDKVLLPAM